MPALPVCGASGLAGRSLQPGHPGGQRDPEIGGSREPLRLLARHALAAAAGGQAAVSFPTLPTPTGAPRCAGRSEGAPCCLPSRVPRAHPWASPARPCPALPCPALPCALALLRSKTCGAGQPRPPRPPRPVLCVSHELGEPWEDPRPDPGGHHPPYPKHFPRFSSPGLFCTDPGRWHALLSLTCQPGTVVGRWVTESL